MSYNGTVRCSYCYQTGHNSRTCPTKNDHLKQHYEKAIQQGDYRADRFRQEYEARTGRNINTGAVLPKQKKVTKVNCGYCGRQGHTRRTCRFLKSDRKVFAEVSKFTRKAMWEKLVNYGVGVGSLVPVRSFQYLDEERGYGYAVSLRYITGFSWEGVHWGYPYLNAMHKDIKDIAKPNAYEDGTNIDRLISQSKEDVAAEFIPAGMMSTTSTYNMPKGWLDFEDEKTVKFAYKQFFTTKKGLEKRRHEFRFPNEQMREIIIRLGLTDDYPNMIT